MTALKKVKSHPDVVEYFKELPFYNKHIKKPKITKTLKKHWFGFWNSFLWRTECNKNKCVSKICSELQSRINWGKKTNSQKQVNQVLKTCLVIL